FPECRFHLVDSRQKKIKVVQEIVQHVGLNNVQISVQRVEQLAAQYDFVVSRAVASMDKFIPWVRKRIHCRNKNALSNGILYLRGEGVEEEMRKVKGGVREWDTTPVSNYFEQPFFETKHLLYVNFCD
ncbi:MAG: RsmG family class I SAM-dependent methyltransferase, partial [Bacteroidota bacterium]